jgi:integrating conjugative element protein (TIGR03761 family)
MAKSDKDTAAMIRQRGGAEDLPRLAEQERPGPVQPKATIRLHTFIGHQLFFGRQDTRPGGGREQCFTLFASNLNSLWTCAMADDPYADARLIQVEEQIDRVKVQLKELMALMDELLTSMEDAGIRAEAQSSVRPVDVPIGFRAVHAAVAVQLLGMTDRVILKALAARHFGLVTAQDWQRILSQTVTPMRHLFELSRFRASGAARDDFAANNARARAALEKLGQLPADILQGLRRPKLGPNPSRSLVFAGDDASAGDSDDSMLAQSLKALNQKWVGSVGPSARETVATPIRVKESEAAPEARETEAVKPTKRAGAGGE